MYSSVMSPLKERLVYSPPKTVESSENNTIIIPSISRVDKVPERSISANSILPSKNRSLIYHNKAIEYLTSQFKTTLEKLHLEVANLKTENQRLNFKLVVEDNGGVEKIVNESLSENRTLRNHIRLKKNEGSEISNEKLLNETIRDLKIKLDISEDANRHLNSTIRNLKQKMSMMKRFNGSESSEAPTNERYRKPTVKSSSRKISNHSLNTSPEQPENKLANGDLQLGYVHSQKSQSKVKLSKLHFPTPPPLNKIENSSSEKNLLTSKNSRPNFIKRQSQNPGNKYDRILDEKDNVIEQLTTQNSVHKNRISELENILGELQRAFQNKSRSEKNNKSGSTGLRSTASKNSFHLPNINQHNNIVGSNANRSSGLERDFLINYDEDA